MGKYKKKLRAQRKFAQGAFIPPQNNPSTSGCASVTHASHKAVNAPGPVLHNYCSAKDILTRMSLGRAHPHDNWQPVVRLEYDCGSTTGSEGAPKKKLKNKKKIKIGNLKKKYVFRNRQKSLASNNSEKRRVSISDSGEDTPLSFLTSREDSKMSALVADHARKSNMAIPPNISSVGANIRPRKRLVVKQSGHPRRTAAETPNTKFLEETPVPERTLPETSGSTVLLRTTQTPSPTSRPSSPVIPSNLTFPSRTSPVMGSNMPVTSRTLPMMASNIPVTSHTSPNVASNMRVPSRTSPVMPRKLPVPSHTSPNSSHTSPIPQSAFQMPIKVEVEALPVSAHTSPVSPQAVSHTSPTPSPAPPAAPVSEASNPRKRQIKPYLQDSFVYGNFSDTSSLTTYNWNNERDDPDYDISASCSNALSEYSAIIKKHAMRKVVTKNNAKRRKILLTSKNKTPHSEPPHYVKRRKIHETPENDAPHANNVSDGFSSASSTTPFQGFVCPDINSPALDDDTDMPLNQIPTIEPLESTAQWINSHHQDKLLSSAIVASSRLIPPGSNGPTSSINARLTASGGIVYSTPGNIPMNFPNCNSLSPPDQSRLSTQSHESTASAIHDVTNPENCSTVGSVSSTSEQAAEDSTYFKLPHLPVFRSKHNKNNNCPTRLMDDLQELLNIQPDKNDVICNACKRCELLSKYKKILRKLPVSDANEPDILETTPTDVYAFESDDEGLKYLRRGRELVRNVLTTKRFPIWLSNLKMNLNKTMFLDEHKLGTLKRTIIFDQNVASDDMVNKVITRVDYLNRCLNEDMKELNAEKPRRKLRSAKRSGVPVGRKMTRAGPHRAAPPAPRNQPTGTAHTVPDSRQLAESCPSSPPQVSPNKRHLVVCLTPLEEMVEQERASTAANATQNSIGVKTIPVRRVININSNSEHTQNVQQKETLLVAQHNIDSSSVVFDFTNTVFVEGLGAYSNFENHTSQQQPTLQQPSEQASSTLVISEKLIYRPTQEEFTDPIAYIGKIQQEASKYGICKIIPPEGFEVPCHLDDNAVFTTINQYLGRLYQRWGPTSREMTSIQAYVATLANPRKRDQFTKAPMFDGVELDLVKLYHTVLRNGGIGELLAHSEKWARIAEQMCLVSPRGKPDHKKLEKLYCKHVLPYESLTNLDRQKFKGKVDRVWTERSKSAMRRANRPLHYQKRMLGETQSDDEEPALDKDIDEVRQVGKQCFDKIEECTGKGRTMNLATYRRIAAQIQSMRFANGPAPTTNDIEDEYWALLALGNEHVSVLSAFIDTSVDNLGHTSDPAGPGGSHPWNLKRLSENPSNVLSSLGKTLSVTVPTLCLNQLFSTNCWHMDPHKLAWMDVMHEGTTKIWYAVSEHDANDFRRTMEVLAPAAVQRKGIWLASDTTMVPPGLLTTNGVKLQRLEQNAGEFIVVFPGAYASSIATGLTISESIYFQNKFWIYSIDHIFQQMRLDCEPAMFSNTLLLLRMARDPRVSADVLPQVHFSVCTLIADEIDARCEADKFNCEITLDQSGRPDGGRTPISWPHQDECSICRAPLILSKTVRYNDHRSLMCLKHGLRVYSVAPPEERGEVGPPVTLLYSEAELQAINNALDRRLLERALPNTTDEHG